MLCTTDYRPRNNNQRAIAPAIAALVVIAISAITCAAETWAERLGFPANHKVVIVHAHNFGMCHEANVGVTRLLESGAIRSATAMAPCPWFDDAAAWSAAHPQADIGLDLTVNSEFEHYRWRPIASDALAASLLDPDRFMWRSPIQTMVNATSEDVENELSAQIAYAKSRGLRPTHLTTHLGALVTRPDLIEVYLRVARQNWIPAMVVEVTPEQLERFRAQGFPLPDELVQLFADYPLPKLDDLRLLPPAKSFEEKKTAFLALLHDLPSGLTQIAFHPAIESEALKQITPDWQQCVWESNLLNDPDVQAALAADGVIVTDWQEVMQRFEGNSPAAEKKTAPAEPAPAK